MCLNYNIILFLFFLFTKSIHSLSFFFSSRRRHTIWNCDWSSDVCSSDLVPMSQNTTEIQRGNRLGLSSVLRRRSWGRFLHPNSHDQDCKQTNAHGEPNGRSYT